MTIIPKPCLSLLPFLPESISKWSDESDFMRFTSCVIAGLGNTTDWTATADGPRTLAVNSDLGASEDAAQFFDDLRALDAVDSDPQTSGLGQFQIIADAFLAHASAPEKLRTLGVLADPLPDFEKDENFGLMAKYLVVWEDLTGDTLAEAAFFSLAHLKECGTELDCSILLASNLYFKQALETLRSYLEEMIVQLYFCDNLSDFDKWKRGEFRVPAVRGKGRMIETLIKRRLLPMSLGDTLALLYGELNGSIHGAEKRLIHQGVFEGKQTGRIFTYDRFREWCHYIARCIDFGINVLFLIIEYWNTIRPKDRVMWYICHNTDHFDIRSDLFDGKLVSFTCRQCGETMYFDPVTVSRFANYR